MRRYIGEGRGPGHGGRSGAAALEPRRSAGCMGGAFMVGVRRNPPDRRKALGGYHRARIAGGRLGFARIVHAIQRSHHAITPGITVLFVAYRARRAPVAASGPAVGDGRRRAHARSAHQEGRRSRRRRPPAAARRACWPARIAGARPSAPAASSTAAAARSARTAALPRVGSVAVENPDSFVARRAQRGPDGTSDVEFPAAQRT